MAAPTEIDLAKLDEPSFQRLYAERIAPCFRASEADRLGAVATLRQRVLIAVPVTFLIGYGVYAGAHEAFAGIVALVVCALSGWAIAYAPLAKVGRTVKRAYCSAIAEAMGAHFTVNDFDPPALDRIKALRLLPSYARSKFEDKFTGAYQGSTFDVYEAHLEQRHTDSKGNTHYATVFRGQIVRMHFPRGFLGVTIVRRDAGVFNAFGGGLGLKRVGLEDPVFEKAFEVWGNDQVEARYLLHPALMQRLLDLEAGLKGKRLRCAFEGGDLLVAVEGGNLFEPGDLFRPLDDHARARRVVDDLAGVVRVMEHVLTAQARRG